MSNHPNLARLNELLKDPALALPIHRIRVDASGHNLKFLRKAIPQNVHASPELKDLLAMNDKQLMAVEKKAA